MRVLCPETAFVLGAGFSAHAKFPVIKKMRKAVLDHVESEPATFFKHQNVRDQFYEGLEAPDEALAADGRILDESFEELLIELGKMKTANMIPATWITDQLLRYATGRLLWKLHHDGLPDAYLRFASFAWDSVGIISFNWDVLIEMALHQKGKAWGYDPKVSLSIIKPHGSNNWSSNEQYGARGGEMWRHVSPDSSLCYIPPSSETDHAIAVSQAFYDPFPDGANLELTYMLFPGDPDSPNCAQGLANAEKVAAEQRLLWKQAGELISRASKVVFIGYSLPSYDKFAKRFLIDACKGKQVEVINPNPIDAEKLAREFGISSPVTLALKNFEESEYANDWPQTTRQPNAPRCATQTDLEPRHE